MTTKSPSRNVKKIISVEHSIGKILPPSTEDIISELKLLLSNACIQARNSTNPKTTAQIISYLCKSLSNIVSLEKLTELGELNLTAMTDEEIKNHAEKLISSLTH